MWEKGDVSREYGQQYARRHKPSQYLIWLEMVMLGIPFFFLENEGPLRESQRGGTLRSWLQCGELQLCEVEVQQRLHLCLRGYITCFSSYLTGR